MALPILGILEIGARLLDKFIPDPQAKAEAQLKLLEMQQSGELQALAMDTQLMQGQIDINKIEAQSDSLFKSGWRPATGWMCVAGFGYQVLLAPIFGWITANLWGWNSPPPIEIESLMTLLFALLGLGGYRTIEKIRGKA